MSHEPRQESPTDSDVEVGSAWDSSSVRQLVHVGEDERKQIEEELAKQEEELNQTPYQVALIGDPDAGKAAVLDAIRTRAVATGITQPEAAAGDPEGNNVPVKYTHRSEATEVHYKNLAEPTIFFYNASNADKETLDVDGVLVCFDIDQRTSFDHVRDKWMVELKQSCPGIPTTLLGIRSDQNSSTSKSKSDVTFKEAQRLSRKLGMQAYIEYRMPDETTLSTLAGQCASDARFGRLVRRRNLTNTNPIDLPLPERIFLYAVGALVIPPAYVVGGIGTAFEKGFGLRPLIHKARRRSRQEKTEDAKAV